MDLENDVFEVMYRTIGRVTQGIPRKGYRLKLEEYVPLKDTEYISKPVKLWDVDWAFKFSFDRESSSIIISLINLVDEKDSTKQLMRTKSNVRGTCLNRVYSCSFDSDTDYPGEYSISDCDNNTFKIQLSERDPELILDEFEDHEEAPDQFDFNLEWNVWEDEDDKYQTQEALRAKVNRKPRLEELSKDMKKALKTGNVTLRCLGKDLPANKYILEARSSVFRTMFQSRWSGESPQVVEVKDQDGQFVCPEVVTAMLGWIYTGAVENTSVNLDLLKLANFYDLHMLETQCQAILIDRMDKENVIDMLIVADRICAKDLKEKAMDFVILVKRELGEEIKNIGPLLLKEIAEIEDAEPTFIGSLETAFERSAKRIKISNEVTCKIEAIPSEMCRMNWEIDHIFPVGTLKRWKSPSFYFADIKWKFYLDLRKKKKETDVIVWLISKKIPKEWGLSAKNSTLYAKYSLEIDEYKGIEDTHYQSHPLEPDEEEYSEYQYPVRRDVTSSFNEYPSTDRNKFEFSIDNSYEDSFQDGNSLEIEFNLYWDQIKSPNPTESRKLEPLLSLESLSNDLAQMLSNSDSHDVWIKCQGIEIGAHREILSARSSFFETLFQKDPNMTNFELNEVKGYPLDPGQVQGLLNWIYTGHFGGSDPMQMLKLGKYLNLEPLYDEAAAILANSLSKDNVIDILVETYNLGIPPSQNCRIFSCYEFENLCIYAINRLRVHDTKEFDEKISKELLKLIYDRALDM